MDSAAPLPSCFSGRPAGWWLPLSWAGPTRHLVSFDMGGTSDRCVRIEGGRPEVSYQRGIDGYPCRMPAVAVHTVPRGGAEASGSIRAAPCGLVLKVPARSSWPATEGEVSSRTVTDADWVIGRLSRDAPGRFDTARPRSSTTSLDPSGWAARHERAHHCARVEARMERAVRTVSVEEGANHVRQCCDSGVRRCRRMHATALAGRLEMTGCRRHSALRRSL